MAYSFKIKRRRHPIHRIFSDDILFKSALKWFFFIFLIFTLQTKISLFDNPLNLSVLLVYAYVLKSIKRSKKAELQASGGIEIKCSVFGGLVGILEDFIAGAMLGSSFLSLGLVGFLGAILFTNVLFKWTPLLGVIIITAFTIFSGLTNVILRIIFTDLNISIHNVVEMILLQTLINMPFGILVQPSERD